MHEDFLEVMRLITFEFDSVVVLFFYRATAMLSAVYAVVVCLCVCVSVTLRYCIKTAKRRIT